MLRIGYARVSSRGQQLAIQQDKLTQAGCQKLFTEQESGLDQARPQLNACLEYLREGDTLVITRLDRLARSATHLGSMVEQLQHQKVDLVVLDQHIDTTQPMGKLMFHLLAAFAEFEWALRKERQAEGLAKAKQQGVKLGRRLKLTPEQVQSIQQGRQSGMTIRQLMQHYHLSKASVYRALKASQSVEDLS